MPELLPEAGIATARPVALRDLLADLATLVESMDAVIRLEPTIKNRLRQISADPVTLIAPGANAPDGVALRSMGHELDATVEVAVRPSRPAAEIADEIRLRVRDRISSSGWTPGVITVSVLAVERPVG